MRLGLHGGRYALYPGEVCTARLKGYPVATNMNLRSKIIRLAHSNPELRPHLLPILTRKGRVTVAARAPVDDPVYIALLGAKGLAEKALTKALGVRKDANRAQRLAKGPTAEEAAEKYVEAADAAVDAHDNVITAITAAIDAYVEAALADDKAGDAKVV